MDELQKSKEEHKQSSSHQCTRWKTDMDREKLLATWQKQGSCHTRILGTAFKIQYFDAIWRLPKREVCNFTKHGHMQSFSTTHYLQLALRKRKIYVNSGKALPEGALNSESATSCLKIELATWFARSTKPRRKIILEPSSDSKRNGETCNSSVDRRIAREPLSAVEPQNTSRENEVKRLIEMFENHENNISLVQDLTQTEKIDKFSKESQDLIADMNNTKIFELFENSPKQQCTDCNAYWEWECLLQLWKKYEVYAESSRVRPEQPWRHLNPWICDQEKEQSWSEARTFWKTKDVVPGETDASKGPTVKARRTSCDTPSMVRRRRIQEVIGNLKIGDQNWQRLRSEEKIPILCESQTLPTNNWTFEQFKEIQEKVLLILHCKTIDWFRKNGWIPEVTNLKNGTQAVFFASVHPMEDGYGSGETSCDLTEARIMPYKNTWKRFQNTVFWCHLEIAHTTQYLQLALIKWYIYENSGKALPEGALNSESATSCLKIELATWFARSTKPRRKIILEPSSDSKRYGETCNSSVDHRIARVLLSAKSRGWSRCSRTTRIIFRLFRTWHRRRRSTSSAKNRKTWSPTWTTPRYSNFAKILPNSNVLIAMPTGKWE